MCSVLIVDDDEGMVDTLSDILSEMRYAVSTASSGESAIFQALRTHFDLVLMDIKMPGLNGVEALQAMTNRNPDIKVIMMTAFTRDELVEQARAARAVAVVSKPLDLDQLLDLVGRTTGSSGGARRNGE